MKKILLTVAVALASTHFSAHADQATLNALVEAKVVLTDAQKAEVLAQSCTDAASCNALVETVAKIAASQAGNDAAVTAVHTAFAKVHPAQSAAAIDRTVALAPATAVTLAVLQLETQATAAGPLNAVNNRVLAQVNNNALAALQRATNLAQNTTSNLGQSIAGVVAPSSPSQP